MNVIERNNIKISGQGRETIIFAHGFGCDQKMWSRVAPSFERDHHVVLFDHVGAGRSDLSAYNTTKYSTLHGYADDVVEICEALDITGAVFVGHSVSAMIGVLAAIKAPARFKSLVLIGPSPCYINDGDYVGGFDRATILGLLGSLESNYQDWSKAMAPVIMGNLDRPTLGAELTESFCSVKPEIAKHFAQVTFLSDNRSDLARLTVPSLILQCSEDAIAPVQVGRYLQKKLKGSEFVQLKATGHCPHVSAPEETLAAIGHYLRKAG